MIQRGNRFCKKANILVCAWPQTTRTARLAIRILPLLWRIDLLKAITWGKANAALQTEEAECILRTQFRSLEILRIAKWLVDDEDRACALTDGTVGHFPRLPPAVWYVDNFGNLKTTISANEFPEVRPSLSLTRLPVHRALSDVPEGTLAWVTGSSGFRGDRLMEIVLRGGSARERLNHLKAGKMLAGRS